MARWTAGCLVNPPTIPDASLDVCPAASAFQQTHREMAGLRRRVRPQPAEPGQCVRFAAHFPGVRAGQRGAPLSGGRRGYVPS